MSGRFNAGIGRRDGAGTCGYGVGKDLRRVHRAASKVHSSRVQDAHHAEDILQEIFLKVHNGIDSLKDEQKITAWVYRIARNTISDYYRKQSRQNRLPLEDGGTVQSPAEISENSEIAACVRAMIACLPHKYKEAIMLSEFENLSIRELGERIGLSLSGAKTRVQRARNMLKDMLLGCCSFEFDHMGNIIDYKRREKDCTTC